MARHTKGGNLMLNGVPLYRHENQTIIFLLSCGYDIELIPKSNIPNHKTADFKMLGLEWEMKSPKGAGKWLLKNTIQKASHQAENIVIDLRRVKIEHHKCLSEIENHFNKSKRVKRIKVITKTKEIVDFCE